MRKKAVYNLIWALGKFCCYFAKSIYSKIKVWFALNYLHFINNFCTKQK